MQSIQSIPERAEFLKSPAYQEILDVIEKIVKDEYNHTPPISGLYTKHDDSHCLNVEKYIYTLIPREFYKLLKPRERFIILASVWLHDIGMIPSLFSKRKEFLNYPELPADRPVNKLRFFSLEGQKYLKEIRKKHATRSSYYIQYSKKFEAVEEIYRKHNKERQYEKDIKYISEICRLHPHKEYTDLEKLNEKNWIKNKVRVPLLTAYLRLADALHIPDKGTEQDFLNFLAQGPDDLAKFHWFKSMFTQSIDVDPEKHEIKIVTKKPPNLESSLKGGIDSLQEQMKLEIEDELDSVKDILCKGGISTYSKVTISLNEDSSLDSEDLKVEYEQVLKSIDLIFNTTKTPSSSLIAGNIIDTLKIFLKSGEDLEQKRLYLEMYQNSCLENVKKKKSVHALLRRPLEKVDNFVTDKSQASYDDLLNEVDNWKKIRSKNLHILSSHAAGIFADGSPILLYGYSETILDCIRHFIEKYPEKTLKLYVCEVRSKTEYRYNNRLAFSDGLLNIEALKQIDPVRIKLHYIPDVAVAHLFANNTIDHCTNFKVILSVNAIDDEGNATHTVGARTIVEIASIYHVPVYIVAEAQKILEASPSELKTNLIKETQENPKDRENAWLTTDIHFETILNGCTNYNPREDVILSKFITSYITEKGITRPELIKSLKPNQEKRER